jgi:hypothetical protein
MRDKYKESEGDSMKIIAITMLIMGALTTLTISLDILLGIGVSTSILNAIRPFRVMDATEIFVILLFTLLFFTENILFSIKKRKKKSNS